MLQTKDERGQSIQHQRSQTDPGPADLRRDLQPPHVRGKARCFATFRAARDEGQRPIPVHMGAIANVFGVAGLGEI